MRRKGHRGRLGQKPQFSSGPVSAGVNADGGSDQPHDVHVASSSCKSAGPYGEPLPKRPQYSACGPTIQTEAKPY